MKPGNHRHAFVHQLTSNERLQRIKDENYVVEFQPIFKYGFAHCGGTCGERTLPPQATQTAHRKTGNPHRLRHGCPGRGLQSLLLHLLCHHKKDLKGRPEGGYRRRKRWTSLRRRCLTIGSAYCEFAENEKGRIKEGYLADLIVLDNDVFTSEPEKIRDTKVLLSIIGGEVVYEAEGFL